MFYEIIAAFLLLLIVAIRLLGRRKKKYRTEMIQLTEYSEAEASENSSSVSPITPPPTTRSTESTAASTAVPGEVAAETSKTSSDEPPPHPTENVSTPAAGTRTWEARKLSFTPEQLEELAKLDWETAPPTLPPPPPIPDEEEQRSNIKYIGYHPINVFAQTEPLHFPYVVMPAAHSVIKFPRKGRQRRKGYTEDHFKVHLHQHFAPAFQIFDDRRLPLKGNSQPFEPDLVLIKETDGINLFVDVEIDEPYEGINDIANRKAMHYQLADGHRNQWFVDRGWIVIRFAEIQVHQHPDACCRFIADVIKAVDPRYIIPAGLQHQAKLAPVKQWTKAEAEAWSTERYRERYLGITSFGLTPEGSSIAEDLRETTLDEAIEAQVIETPFIPPPTSRIDGTALALSRLIETALRGNKYLSFKLEDGPTIVRPLQWNGAELKVFCYVKNKERSFRLSGLRDLHVKDCYYSLRLTGPTVGVDKIKHAVNMAVMYHRYIRIKYTRSAWNGLTVDQETGEVILDFVEAEESIRTISDVQLAINALDPQQILYYNLDENYIRAYCHRREAERTFKFSRISEMEILDF